MTKFRFRGPMPQRPFQPKRLIDRTDATRSTGFFDLEMAKASCAKARSVRRDRVVSEVLPILEGHQAVYLNTKTGDIRFPRPSGRTFRSEPVGHVRKKRHVINGFIEGLTVVLWALRVGKFSVEISFVNRDARDLGVRLSDRIEEGEVHDL